MVENNSTYIECYLLSDNNDIFSTFNVIEIEIHRVKLAFTRVKQIASLPDCD